MKSAEENTPDIAHVSTDIQSVVAHLNERVAKDSASTHSPQLTFSVEPCLARKTVTLVGEDCASPVEVAAAIADIYGLRLNRAPDAPTVETIARVQVKPTDNAADIGELAHKALPLPLLTALKVDQEDVLRAMPTYNMPKTREQSDLMLRKIQAHDKVTAQRRDTVSSAARQLLNILKPILSSNAPTSADSSAQPPTKTVALAELSPYAQSCFSVYAFSSLLMELDEILYTEPFISHFDELCLTCVRNDSDKSRPQLMFGFYRYDDEKQGLGMGYVFTSIPAPDAPPQADK